MGEESLRELSALGGGAIELATGMARATGAFALLESQRWLERCPHFADGVLAFQACRDIIEFPQSIGATVIKQS